MLSRSTELWAFASEVYTNSTVSSACLELQDEYGVDVPVLLFCSWAAWRYGELKNATIKDIKACCQSWSSITTEPLRHLRRQMKTGYHAGSAISKDQWFAFREEIKGLELESEKILLQSLAGIVEGSPAAVGQADTAIANIHNCIDIENEKATRLIAQLVATIFD